MDDRRVALSEVVVGDDPAAWWAIGFAAGDGDRCRVGAVDLHLAGVGDNRGRGLLAWAFSTVECGLPGDVDGVRTTAAPAAQPPGPAPRGPSAHPNGATLLDHVVVVTPDLDRTTAALGALGLAPRRTREAGGGRLQRFFRAGAVVVEVVGPAEPAGDGPARLWGLAFTVADIDATAALLGDRLGTVKPAVQPGRRIATLRSRPDVSVPVAFMSAEGADPVSPRGEGAGRL